MSEQGTDEWKRERLGKATASRISDIIAKTKTGWGASRANYMAELVAERLTGVVQDAYVSPAMQHGIDTEAAARAAYEWHAVADVQMVGFIPHPTIAMAGASPDGLVGDSGLVEIKCPNTATHIETLLGAKIADKYLVQMAWQMACTGRQWCDWVSYDNRLPEEMRLVVLRVKRNDNAIKMLEAEVVTFLHEVDAKIDALTKKFSKRDAQWPIYQ